ncbi:MAG: T9SS type A sorting domain-containing protein [Balneolaceae bacterium]
MKKLIPFFIFFCLLSSSLFAQIKLVSSSPANGDFAVEQDSIVLEFNLPVYIDTEYPEASGFYFFIEPEHGVYLDSVTVSENNTKVTFHGQLADDTDYIAILEKVIGMNGESLESPHIIQFTTADQAGEFTVSGKLTTAELDKLKSTSDSYNGVVVVLSPAPFDLDLNYDDDYEYEEDYSEEEEFIPLFATTVDTLTGEYEISGVREGTYYPVGINIFQIQDQEIYYDFFFPDIYYYDANGDLIPDSILVNTETTTDNMMADIDLILFDLSPITFSEAKILAENLMSGEVNDPIIMGGATSYFMMDYYYEETFKRNESGAFSTSLLRNPAIKIRIPDKFTQSQLKAKSDEPDIIDIFSEPSGYHLLWEVFVYDEEVDSVLYLMVTPFGSEVLHSIGIEEAPEGVTFSDIKPLPETYIDSDAAAEIAEAEGGMNFRNNFSGMTENSYGYWDMYLQILHEFWTYTPDPTPNAPVFWKAEYYGSKYDYNSDEYVEDYFTIFIDVSTGEVLYKETSLSEAITFPQAVEMAQTFLEDFENDPVIMGGETEYRHEPPYIMYKGVKPVPPPLNNSFMSNQTVEDHNRYGYQSTPNGYQSEWNIYAYDAVRDSALGVMVTADTVEFLGYFGQDEAQLPEGVGFGSLKPLPETYIDSETAVNIMEAQGGEQFRNRFTHSDQQMYGSWDLWVMAMHYYWEYEPNPTEDAPVMWVGQYYGSAYGFETDEYIEDSLFVFLDIETGDVLHMVVSNEEKPDVPDQIQLLQNYPNPFNPSTNIPFELNQASRVELSIYNMLGQKVSTLANDAYPAGSHTLTWNASGFASGVYFYRLEAGGVVQTRKLMLLK